MKEIQMLHVEEWISDLSFSSDGSRLEIKKKLGAIRA
jgi:hypothetical protein